MQSSVKPVDKEVVDRNKGVVKPVKATAHPAYVKYPVQNPNGNAVYRRPYVSNK